MKGLMGMSGFRMFIIPNGGPIFTEDGSGILLLVGIGCLMTLGDGVFPITEDGTGD